uniref:Biotin carboxyl carrier protein of acetyl-CoA carboxylase n=1 Tax=Choreocolax polysiphoniae TaxID=282351 RepID=A0A0B5W5G2_9FLOR|nr:biotin carboxyl carrier protein of acetyl-CoA carboxylase [Choreocolax polysiphoniae]AJH65826.1 biotin carboxyl carrier protein of acetyl-CoA carboxylase [Choreocolax polysiphoniae]
MTSLQNIIYLINSINKNDIQTIQIKNRYKKILINKIKITQKNYNNNYIRYRNNNKTIKIIDKNQEIKTSQSKKIITYSTIISPMVGTFYRSASPNEPPFIKLNDIIKRKQTVCIIEAMKLMNEIESEINGEIIDILVKDGDIVNCGQALIKIKKI